jgi:hypothetical protein
MCPTVLPLSSFEIERRCSLNSKMSHRRSVGEGQSRGPDCQPLRISDADFTAVERVPNSS